MTEVKTKVNDASVEGFLSRVPNATRRADAFELLQMMTAVTRKPAKMWGPSIVGFDQYHYKYESGHEGDICMIGFSPRKQALTIYVMPGFARYSDLLQKLGKCSTGVGCLYINKLADVDQKVLRELVKEAYRHMKATHGRPSARAKTSDPRPAAGRAAATRRRRS